MLLGAIEKVGFAIGKVAEIIKRFIPSAEERAGRAEAKLKQKNEVEDAQQDMEDARTGNVADDVADSLRDSSF